MGIGDSADKHARLLTEVRSYGDLRLSHMKHMSDSEVRHGSVEQRLAFLEKEVGDSFDKHAKQLDVFKKAHDRHAKQVDELKISTMAYLEERMAYLGNLACVLTLGGDGQRAGDQK